MRVFGQGPAPAKYAFVAEKPGREEARTGQPMVGPTSRDFNKRYLPDCGLRREDVFITNIHREFIGDGEYTAEQTAEDVQELMAELSIVEPKVLVTIGAQATRLFLGNVDLDEVHGIPWVHPDDVKYLSDGTKYWEPGECRIIFPTHHTASRTPEMQSMVVYDFAQLKRVVAGALKPRAFGDDQWKGKEKYELIERPGQIYLYADRPIFIDSEGSAEFPFSMQWSQAPGKGYMILATDKASLAEFDRQLQMLNLPIVYHNALHDLVVMRSMGIETSHLRFGDTMVGAYLLQLEPQGLKALCVRHAGMEMQSYTEIIGDAANEKAGIYLQNILETETRSWAEYCHEEMVRLNTTPYVNAKGKTVPGRKLKKAPSLPKSRLLKSVERCVRSIRPRGLWEDQDEDIHVAAYSAYNNMPEASLHDVPFDKVKYYACRDSDGTSRIAPIIAAAVEQKGLGRIYNLEMSTYPLIDRMQQIGLKPDLPHFKRLSTKLGVEIENIQADLIKLTGDPSFNANSGNQVAALLYDRYELPGSKRTSSGRYSTNDKILEGLEHEFGTEYPAITRIRDFREVYKLKNTFVDRIPDFAERWPFDGRIHATFRTTRVVTGRLAASEPNILAQPEHGTFAKEFKRGWIAEPGHVLCSWDQSQIELRILAHLSEDPYMRAVFRGEKRNPDGSLIDLHAALAQRIFGVPPHLQDKSKHRLPAKAINFGIPMGMQAQGLLVQLRKEGLLVSLDDAQRWLDETLDTYPGVAAYQKFMIAEARRTGITRCMSGRIRYVGGINSWDERTRAEAERFSFSTPIQEGAQYVMKTVEVEVWKMLLGYRRTGHWCEPLAQIHDALKFECQAGMQYALNERMRDLMINTYQGLSVPLDVEGEWGMTFAPKWEDKKKGIIFCEEGTRGFDE